jgi:hypothetical protein
MRCRAGGVSAAGLLLLPTCYAPAVLVVAVRSQGQLGVDIMQLIEYLTDVITTWVAERRASAPSVPAAGDGSLHVAYIDPAS